MLKNTFLIATAAGILALSSCSKSPDAAEATVGDKTEVASSEGLKEVEIDTTLSSVSWTGSKVVGDVHVGALKIEAGSLALDSNIITGGKFVIPMSSLAVLDKEMEDQYKAKLKKHLLAEDFFNAEKHPKVSFEIASVTPLSIATEKVASEDTIYLKDCTHNITGNLTIKDSTKSITFPAKVINEGGKVLANARFKINRTLWGVNYGADQSLGNKMIRPEVVIDINLVTK